MAHREGKLNLLCDDLKKKLSALEDTRRNMEIYWQQELEEVTNEINVETKQTLNELKSNIEKLCDLHRQSGNTLFFYEIPQADFFAEEDKFTASLTEYTKKQFFQGIAEISGVRGKNEYEMLDLTKPESQLDKGELQATKLNDREEIRRLQSQYLVSEERRLNSEIANIRLKKIKETAEKQLELLSSGKVDFNEEELTKEIEIMQGKTKDLKERINENLEGKMKPLLQELHQLHAAKILTGNYDLKISRQNYFLSKQEENMISDPIFNAEDVTRETIASRDAFANTLYEAIVPETSYKDELYRTYNNMIIESQVQAKERERLCTEHSKLERENQQQFEVINTTLKDMEVLLTKQKTDSVDEFSALVDELQDSLGIAELQINDVIKDIVAKRKILASDPIKEMERTIFPNFFNDPSRLKRMLGELDAKVKAYSLSS